jgi:segregation and condensation protein B
MNESNSYDSELSLIARIEALLFIAPGAVSPSQLASTLRVTTNRVEKGLKELEYRYLKHADEHGLRLQTHHGRIQLTTAPQAADDIETFLGLEDTSRLSRAALETLAIVAYQEPITRPQVDAIRGVHSDGVLKTLLSRGLIEEVGRAEAPGRPILYSITPDFLQHFGLNSLDELPPLDFSAEEIGEEQSTSEDDSSV